MDFDFEYVDGILNLVRMENNNSIVYIAVINNFGQVFEEFSSKTVSFDSYLDNKLPKDYLIIKNYRANNIDYQFKTRKFDINYNIAMICEENNMLFFDDILIKITNDDYSRGDSNILPQYTNINYSDKYQVRFNQVIMIEKNLQIYKTRIIDNSSNDEKFFSQLKNTKYKKEYNKIYDRLSKKIINCLGNCGEYMIMGRKFDQLLFNYINEKDYYKEYKKLMKELHEKYINIYMCLRSIMKDIVVLSFIRRKDYNSAKCIYVGTPYHSIAIMNHLLINGYKITHSNNGFNMNKSPNIDTNIKQSIKNLLKNKQLIDLNKFPKDFE